MSSEAVQHQLPILKNHIAHAHFNGIKELNNFTTASYVLYAIAWFSITKNTLGRLFCEKDNRLVFSLLYDGKEFRFVCLTLVLSRSNFCIFHM